jgi:hypothetical protein
LRRYSGFEVALLCSLALATSGLGCTDSESEGRHSPADRATAPATLAQDEIDRLRSLGYVGFSDQKVDSEAPAVTLYDSALSQPGYNLVSNRDLSLAELVDAAGNTVHQWNDPEARHWSNAELLPNGDLLVPGSFRDKSGSFLLRLSWDGDVLWRRRVPAHHDVERMPDGRIGTLLFELRRIPEVDPAIDVKDHKIAILAQDGRLLQQHSLYDLLAGNSAAFQFQPVRAGGDRKPFVDLLHANSLEWMRFEHLQERDPLYSLSHVLVSFRHQDTIAIFDWDRKRLVWAWGQGELSGQHDATLLANGNILIFDNGLDRAVSRIIELDPLRREIVWRYQAAPPGDFFSLRKGSSQRLPNGNTLVANSDSGEAFEITPAGKRVWHYLNPRSDADGNRATIVRIKRYPLEFVDRLLAE